MERKKLEELRAIYTDYLAWELAGACRGVSSMEGGAVYAAAYVLLKAQSVEDVQLYTLDAFVESSGISESRAFFIKECLQNNWHGIAAMKDNFDNDTLLAFLLYNEGGSKLGSESTPNSVIRLAGELMGIKPGDRVADFGTGKGAFIRECFAQQPEAIYYGDDINTVACEVASIRAELLGGNITIVQEDIMDMKDAQQKFDTAFANYPFGLRAKDAFGSNYDSFKEFTRINPEFARTVSLDWLFNKKVLDTIEGTRRAVCIMTNGSTWNTLDKEARTSFIENGCVEAVIALPNNLFSYTPIGTVMVVLSRDNTSVMMVDARELCSRGRRQNVITDDHIDEILSAVESEGAHSKRISLDELKANDYVLNPVRYMSEEVVIENGVPFESVIKKITRGAQLSAADLDGLVSPVPTSVQYLMLQNIRDGIIDDELPYLNELDSKQEKYCIKDKSLILSKNGYPYKVAVAEVPEGSKILANGNLFVIELNEDEVDPYFIKAYLESDKGIAMLKSITVGATIPNIGVEQLKKITVPKPEMSEQKKVAERYLTLVDEIKLLRRKIDRTTSDLKHLFDEGEVE